ncbi:MAG: metalloregulator ArsR/SmtB family transcription factor [Planctomycetes bacterium]|nr:metalloregulator ArsR/SmtB family transcription factor [Planctomycetota bacterium]
MNTAPAISIADLLGSLSDPTRLRLLRVLEQHELTVGEIAQVFQMPQSTASRHLKALSDCGWLLRRTEGTATFYRLVPDDLAETARHVWIAVRSGLAQSAELREDDRRVKGVLAERRTDSVGFFGRVRGEWDQMRAELFGGRFTSAALLALIRPDWVVADVGCGTGNVAELLSPVVERVVAIDQSEPMLTSARERLSSRPNVQFVEATLDRLPIESATIDAAVCMLVLHHVDNPADALKELRRVLRPERGGGVVALVDMVEHDRDEYKRTMGHKHLGFSKESIVSMLTQAGFANPFYQELPTEPQAKGPALFVATGRITH